MFSKYNEEKRKYLRWHKDVGSSLYINNEKYPGIIKNISFDGFCFTSNLKIKNISEEDLGRIELNVKKNKQCFFCKIVWKDEKNLGLILQERGEKTQDRLENVIKECVVCKPQTQVI